MEVTSESIQLTTTQQALANMIKSLSGQSAPKENITDIPQLTGIEKSDIIKILTEFLGTNGMKATEENLKMLTQMLENKIPITTENLKLFNQGIKLFPEGAVEKASFLIDNQINITPGNAEILEGIASHETLINKQIDILTDLILSLEEPELKDQVLREILSSDTEKLPPQSSDSTNSDSAPTENAQGSLVKSEILEFLKEPAAQQATAGDTLHNANDSEKPVITDKAEAIKIIYNIIDSPKEREEILKALDLFDDNEATKSAISKKLFLSPKNVSKTSVENILSKLSDNLLKIVERYENSRIDEVDKKSIFNEREPSKESEKTLSQLNEIRNTMEFVSQVRDNVYMQVPLTINGHKTTGELYVFNGKKKRSSKGENISALIGLDTENLGRLETYIVKSGKNLSFQFRLASEESEKAVRSDIAGLSSKISALGYRIESIMYKNIDEAFSITDKEPLGEALTSIENMAFDARI